MGKIVKTINKLTGFQKVICIVSILVFAILLSISLPTMARYKNRVSILAPTLWDGTDATSYHDGDGSSVSPYVISNGNELAYFAKELLTDHYTNKYFVLKNDIIINDGTFLYDITDGIKYVKDGITYYVDSYTNKYYDKKDLSTRTEMGTINLFNSLKNFEGSFEGNSYKIYGLYVTSNTEDEVALFTGLKGNVSNLYVENSMIYGGSVTSGIASTTTNSIISNVMFNGYVIGNNSPTKELTINPEINSINLSNTPTENNIVINHNLPSNVEIINTSITGNYEVRGDGIPSISINGTELQNGSFNINLGTSLLNNISIVSSINNDNGATLSFSDFSYNITYKYGVSSGIVSISNNTSIINTVNRGYIYGYSISSGLISSANNNTSINKSYNTGNVISSGIVGGLIGNIENNTNNVNISKCYNSSNIENGLIGNIKNNTGNFTISNVFDTSNNPIGNILNTTLNITGSYATSDIEDLFLPVTLENLKTKSYVTSNLSFDEFSNVSNLLIDEEDVWVYETDSLPILYIDDIYNPIASINASIYSWNSYSNELSRIKTTSTVSFNIEKLNTPSNIDKIYYCISNSATPVERNGISGLSWTLYNDNSVIQIAEEGFHIIYAKIVDLNGKETYINSDIFALDLSGSDINITLNNYAWTTRNNNPSYKYIDRSSTLNISAVDELSGIQSISYYLTNNKLASSDVENLTSEWISYSDPININTIGKYIIYVKVIDNNGYVTYANTDYIIYNGYTESNITIGKNESSYIENNINITDKSTLTFNTSYNENISIIDTNIHSIVSNTLLPVNSKITLFDNITNKVYEYVVNSLDNYNYNNSCDNGNCKASYKLTSFYEVGSGNTNKKYQEQTYCNNSIVREDFTIVLDLSNTNISNNYNDVKLYMELQDSNYNLIRPTLNSSIRKFNVYKTVNNTNTYADLYLNTTYNGDGIVFNSNSLTNIPLSSGITYKSINDSTIFDTSYEDKTIGLLLKVVDSTGNLVDSKYLKNFIFKVDDREYYPDNNNMIYIDLNNGINTNNNVLSVITNSTDGNYNNGTYYLKISNYASYDGYYSNTSNEISIPITVQENKKKYTYNFDVEMNNANRIINKSGIVPVTFKIIQSGDLTNPNIKVSLYKKNALEAINQDYSIVNLGNYINNELVLYTNNIYNLVNTPVEYDGNDNTKNEVTLNFKTNDFEYRGYRLVFDLYDDINLVGRIEKNFIIR